MRSNVRQNPNGPQDVGTLWILRRREFTARCALLAWPDEWEVRVVIEGETLLTDRHSRTIDAFTLAADWKRRLLEQAWEPVRRHSA